GDTMQQHNLFVRLRMHPVNSFLDLFQCAHSGGKKDRLAFPSDVLNQRPMRNVSGSDLECIHAELIEEVGALFVKGCGQELYSYPNGFLMQCPECVEGQLELL